MIDYTLHTDILNGKRVLYVHGFASSGLSGTVKSLRQLLPGATIVAPDLPIDPYEAIDLLHRVCDEEHPDLIIGTSMGAMYAEQLYGNYRVLVNPAFCIADTMVHHFGLGRHPFLSERRDGEKDFLITKQLVNKYKEVTDLNFQHVTSEEQHLVFGLFGKHDNLVDTIDLFRSHYPQAICFDGEHRLNDSVLLHSVLPVLKQIDDTIQKRQQPTIIIRLNNALRADNGQLQSSALKACRALVLNYNLFFLSEADFITPDQPKADIEWLDDNLGVLAWNKTILSNAVNLLYADYLIDSLDNPIVPDNFLGTIIHLGDPSTKTWEEIITFFSRLGGQ